MKAEIERYAIPARGEDFTLTLPDRTQILCVDVRHGQAELHVIEPTHDVHPVEWKFRLLGAGQTFQTNGLKYHCTFRIEELHYTWHLFEVETDR